jgi:hypothetical protein
MIAGDLPVVSKADVARRFEGRGPSRATIYRATDDALTEATKQGITVTLAPFCNQWSLPKADEGAEDGQPLEDEAARPHHASAEAIANLTDLDWAGVRAAIAEIGEALPAAGRGSPALAAAIAKLRTALGGSDRSATRIVNLVLSALRADPGGVRMLISVIERIGG